MAGVPESYHYLGLLALQGPFGPSDPAQARVYFESGASQDDPDCILNLGFMLTGAVSWFLLRHVVCEGGV